MITASTGTGAGAVAGAGADRGATCPSSSDAVDTIAAAARARAESGGSAANGAVGGHGCDDGPPDQQFFPEAVGIAADGEGAKPQASDPTAIDDVSVASTPGACSHPSTTESDTGGSTAPHSSSGDLLAVSQDSELQEPQQPGVLCAVVDAFDAGVHVAMWAWAVIPLVRHWAGRGASSNENRIAEAVM